MKDCKITSLEIRDIRFPTSDNLDGSDAMNLDPYYSAAYIDEFDFQNNYAGAKIAKFNMSWLLHGKDIDQYLR